MDKLPMCRICLAKDVRLHPLVNTHLQEIYESLTSLTLETTDKRPLKACYICCAKLRNCYQLKKKCLESEELFTQMLNREINMSTKGKMKYGGHFASKKRVHYTKKRISESTKASTTEVQTITSRKKTNAQKCREYRERKKLQNTMVQNITAERSDERSGTDQLQAKKIPKTNAERRRKHYEAQKLKKQEIKKIPKTVKQKNKEYYDRKKKLHALNTLNHHSDANTRVDMMIRANELPLNTVRLAEVSNNLTVTSVVQLSMGNRLHGSMDDVEMQTPDVLDDVKVETPDTLYDVKVETPVMLDNAVDEDTETGLKCKTSIQVFENVYSWKPEGITQDIIKDEVQEMEDRLDCSETEDDIPLYILKKELNIDTSGLDSRPLVNIEDSVDAPWYQQELTAALDTTEWNTDEIATTDNSNDCVGHQKSNLTSPLNSVHRNNNTNADRRVLRVYRRPANKNKYACETCKQVFTKKSDLIKHKFDVHPYTEYKKVLRNPKNRTADSSFIMKAVNKKL